MSNDSATLPVTPEMLDRIAEEIRGIKARITQSTNISLSRDGLSVIGNRQDARQSDIDELLSHPSSEGQRVGHMPPSPPTLRGRIGAVLVMIVRRALCWYTEQINQTLEWHRAKTADVLQHLAKRQHILTQDHATARRSEAEMREVLSRVMAITEQNRIEQQRTERDFVLRIEQCGQDFAGRIERFERELGGRISSLEGSLKSFGIALDGVEAAVHQKLAEEMGQSVQKMEAITLQTRAMLQGHQSRISLLMSLRTTADGSKDSLSNDRAGSACANLDPSLYVGFEDAFRGARSDIKQRVMVYLPVLAHRRIGTPHMPVLDLGCGRGEWLEVLAENGLTSSGVDSNAIFVEECRERGLNVRVAEAIAFLQELPEQSHGAVTALHVVEHMPFDAIFSLLDEVVRILKPGGVLILETPNPANLIVGAHTFYLDPTHIRPLPTELLRFFVESRGFRNVEIRPLHPFPESYHLQENTKAAAILNEFLYGPRDYAVIGERP
jgi:2-polyprenyl-3-methyl-5-hydroxy-6-metoxy-1,4-benzoquinol methylase